MRKRVPALVLLDVNDFRRIVDLGTRRNKPKKSCLSRKKSGEWKDEQLHIIGARGEFAADKYLSRKGVLREGVNSIIYASHGDAGYDLVLKDGRKVAVKFRHWTDGHLIFERVSDFKKADIAILACGRCDRLRKRCGCKKPPQPRRMLVTLEGWVTREGFWKGPPGPPYEDDWGNGKRWWMPARKLSDMRDLVAEVKKGS